MKARGFTLVELIIVLAIVSIMAVIVAQAVVGHKPEVAPSNSEVVRRATQTIHPDQVECHKGVLVRGVDAIKTDDGAVVKC